MGYRDDDDGAGQDVGGGSGAAVGVDCRGREHEIVLVWSLVSGKAHVRSIFRVVLFAKNFSSSHSSRISILTVFRVVFNSCM